MKALLCVYVTKLKTFSPACGKTKWNDEFMTAFKNNSTYIIAIILPHICDNNPLLSVLNLNH